MSRCPGFHRCGVVGLLSAVLTIPLGGCDSRGGDGDDSGTSRGATSGVATGADGTGFDSTASEDGGTTVDGDTGSPGTGATATSGATTTAGTSPTTAGTSATDSGATTSATGGDPANHPQVTIDTSMGTIVVELDRVNAPITTENFLKYVCDGYYSGLIFHRVIDGFVIQGGGVLPNGSQKNPTYPAIPLEISALRHLDGSLSMARTMVRDSAQAQFYICDGAQGGLDDNYAVFGTTVSGLDVVHAISGVNTGAADRPATDVLINSMTSPACE